MYGDIETTVSFDDEHANYALLQSGWDGDDYLHGAIVHIRLIDGKIWIQYDGTEEGVATELLEAGVPKAQRLRLPHACTSSIMVLSDVLFLDNRSVLSRL